jgi:hypothetical protein
MEKLLPGFVRVLLAWFSIAFVSVGCGQFSGKNGATPEMLEKRISAYWEALVEDDSEKAYLFISPDERDETVRKRFIAGKQHFVFLDYEIMNIEIDGQTARARVARRFKLRSGALGETIVQTLNDKWVYGNGDWYLSTKKNAPLF